MEDVSTLGFRNRSDLIFYKQILDTSQVKDLLKYLATCRYKFQDTRLASRMKITEGEMEEGALKYVRESILTTLSGYFTDLKINYIRIYRHECGETKRHRDISLDGKSNFTVLIYLTDDFEGGKLTLRTRKDENEIKATDPEKKYFHFTLEPKVGYGIVFPKHLEHWAAELVGKKEIILVDLETT